MEFWIELLQTFGLPVVMVFAMGFFIFKLWQQSVEREKNLMAEITQNRLVNEKAIETIALYSERLGTVEADVKEIKQDVNVIVNSINHTEN